MAIYLLKLTSESVWVWRELQGFYSLPSAFWVGPYKRVFWSLITSTDQVKFSSLLDGTFTTALTSCRSCGINKSWAHSAGLPSAVSALPSQHVESNSETSTSLPAWVKVVCTTELVQIGGKQNILEMGNYLNNHLKNQTVLRVAFFFFLS